MKAKRDDVSDQKNVDWMMEIGFFYILLALRRMEVDFWYDAAAV